MQHTDEGERLFLAGDLEGAEACFRRALAENPGDATAHNDLGVLAYRAGRLEEAAMHLLLALHVEPTHLEALGNLCDVLDARGQLAFALPVVERAAHAGADPQHLGGIVQQLEALLGGAEADRGPATADPAEIVPRLAFVGGGRALAVGTGAAGWAAALAAHNRDVVAVGVAEPGESLGAAQRVGGAVEALPVEDRTLDFAAWVGGMPHARLEPALGELARALKPGGRVYLLAEGPGVPLEAFVRALADGDDERARAALESLRADVARAYGLGGARQGPRYRTYDAVAGALNALGFVVVERPEALTAAAAFAGEDAAYDLVAQRVELLPQGSDADARAAGLAGLGLPRRAVAALTGRDDAPARHLRAAAWLRAGEVERAEAELAGLGPEGPDQRYVAGLLAHARGRFALAAEHYGHAGAEDPIDWLSALCQARLGHPERAHAHLDAFAARAPGALAPWVGRWIIVADDPAALRHAVRGFLRARDPDDPDLAAPADALA
ncbi:MAG: tetratricopeptide repeat protein [Myxococcales bacterium]|nr:tetratricopeptide repeat protein [Myxococcales bacterium]